MADVNANIGVHIDTSDALAQLKSLQRQISQFHTSIAKSSEAAALAQRDLQRNFLNSVNALGTFSAELRNVKTTSESFTSSLEKNKFSMREYFRYAGASTQTFGKLFKSEFDTIGKVAEDRVKRLQTQYIKMGRDANGAMKAIAIMPNELDMSNLSTQMQLAAQKQALFNQLMKQGSTNLLNFGKNTQWAGRQLMVGFTLPLMAAGTAAAKSFMQMEAQALKFKKVYGDLFTPQAETQQALDDIQALAKEFTKYGIAVADTVGLAADAAAAGFKGIDLQRQTAQATRLAVLGQIDQNKALETTISLQNAFGISSAELAQNIDFLNAVENQTVTSLDDITTAIPKVAPVIKQLGGDVKDLAFFLTAMKEGGVNASEGANALKSGLASLINPSTKARDMLQSLGIDIVGIVNKDKGNLKKTVVDFAMALDKLAPLQRAQAIEQMFGKFQFARLSALFSNVTKDGTQAARVLQLAGSSIQDLASLSEQELGKTADSSMNKFKKSVEDLKVAIVPVGEAFLKTVTPIIEFISKIADKFSGLSEGTKKAITVMVTVIGGLGPILLMTFGLLANGVANVIKLFLTLRTGYQKLTGQSQNLGEQTQYLTSEQLDAAAAAHSLNQAHATLTQQFTVEATELQRLIAVYESAYAAATKFAAVNPGMMVAPRKPQKFANNGIVRGPGGPKDDRVPIMASNGEAIIDAETVNNNKGLVDELLKTGTYKPKIDLTGRPGGDPRSSSGYLRTHNLIMQTMAAREQKNAMLQAPSIAESFVQKGTQSLNPYVSGHVAGFEPTALPETVKNLQTVMKSLASSTKEQDVALHQLIDNTLKSSIGVQNFGKVINGVATAEASVIPVLDLASKNAAMISGGIGARITGNARNEAFRQAKISEPITYSQAAEAAKIAKPIMDTGKLASGKEMMPKYLAEIQHFIQTTDALSTEQEKAQFGLSNMRKIIADQIVAGNKNISQENLAIEVENKMIALQQNLIKTGAAEFDVKTGLIKSMNDYKAELVFATQQLRTASVENFGAATTSIPGINQATRVAMRSTPKDMEVSLNRKDQQARLVMAGKRTVAALKTQLEGEIPGLQGTGEKLGNAVINGIAKGTGSASDSKKAIQEGKNVTNGFIHELQRGQDNVLVAGEQVGNASIVGIQKGTQGRRIATRPQGPSDVATPVLLAKIQADMIAQKQITENQIKIQEDLSDAAAKEAAARKASIARIGRMNSIMQGTSFALMSMSGIAQMAGGTFGKISSVIFNVSGALFALQTVTQLLTQAKALELIQTRLTVAKRAMSIYGTAPGFAGMLSKLSIGFRALVGPIGIMTATAVALGAGFIALNKARDRELASINELSNAMSTTSSQVKTLGNIFGIVPSKLPYDLTRGSEIVTQATRTQRETIKSSPDFQAQFKDTIRTLSKATAQEAKLAFSSLALNLKAQGFATEQVQAIIDALREESGKTDVVIDVKSLTLGPKSIQSLQSQMNFLIVELNKGLKKSTASERFWSGFIDSILGRSKKAMVYSKDTQKTLSSLSGFIAETSKSAAGLFKLGIIDSKTYENSLLAVIEKTNNLNAATKKLVLMKAFDSLGAGAGKLISSLKTAQEQMIVLSLLGSGQVDMTNPLLTNLKSDNAKVRQKAMFELTKRYKDYLKVVTSVVQSEKDLNDNNNNNTDNALVLSKEAKLTIARLKEELRILKDKQDIIKATNDELKRQNDYQKELLDLQKQSVQAKISGDYIGAAIIQQQKSFVKSEYNKETASIALEKKVDAISGRIAEIESGARITAAELALIKARKKTYATGGLISGPGTGTSDSIPGVIVPRGFAQGGMPIRVSDGEYIIKADTVDKYGVGFFDQLNAQKFAVGGQAKSPYSTKFKGTTSNNNQPKTMFGSTAAISREVNKKRIKIEIPPIRANFDTNSYVLNEEQQKELQSIANELIKYKIKSIVVQGHADSRGGVDNDLLSLNRAKATADFLKNILPNINFVPVGYGIHNPLVPNTSSANMAQNRRAELYLPDQYRTIYPDMPKEKYKTLITGGGKIEHRGKIQGGGRLYANGGIARFDMGGHVKKDGNFFSRFNPVNMFSSYLQGMMGMGASKVRPGASYKSNTSQSEKDYIALQTAQMISGYTSAFNLKNNTSPEIFGSKKLGVGADILGVLPAFGIFGKAGYGSKLGDLAASRYASGNVSPSIASKVLKEQFHGGPTGIQNFKKQDLRGWNFPGTYLTNNKFTAAQYGTVAQKNYGAGGKDIGSIYNFFAKPNQKVNILNLAKKATLEQKLAAIKALSAPGKSLHGSAEMQSTIKNAIMNSKTLDEVLYHARSYPAPSGIKDLQNLSAYKMATKNRIFDALGITSPQTDLITNFNSFRTISNFKRRAATMNLSSQSDSMWGLGSNVGDDIGQSVITNIEKFGSKEFPITQANYPGANKSVKEYMDLFGILGVETGQQYARTNLRNWLMYSKMLAQGTKGSSPEELKAVGNIMLAGFKNSKNEKMQEIARIILKEKKKVFDPSDYDEDFPMPAGFTGAATGGYIQMPKFNMGGIAKNFSVPSYKIGVDYVPQDTLAKLHEGERVLTKEENKSFTNNTPSITNTNNIYINGTDLNKQEIADEVMVRLEKVQKRNNKSNMVVM